MKTILCLIMTFCFSTSAFAGNKLDKIASDFSCGENPPADSTPAQVLGYSALLLDENVSFLGKADKTALFPMENGVVAAGSILVDEKDPRMKHAHARKIYNWLNKYVGAPVEVQSGWVWEVSDVNVDIAAVGLDLLAVGSAVTFICR